MVIKKITTIIENLTLSMRRSLVVVDFMVLGAARLQ